MKYYSQAGQDKFLHTKIFKNFKKGYFIDIGAYDGITFSNTLFFEKKLQWRGICVEPISTYANNIKKIRNCEVENIGISNISGEMTFLHVINSPMMSGIVEFMPKKEYQEFKQKAKTEEIPIPIITFEELKNKHNFKQVHYINIDTEGNELKILQSINFKKTFIHTISVEDNKNEKKVDRILKRKGFILVKHSIFDKIFINTKSPFFKRRLYFNHIIASMWNIYIGSFIDKLTRPITRKMTFLLKLFK